MQLHFVSIFPELIAHWFNQGVVGRAVNNGLIDTHYWNPRDYSDDRFGRVDDRPFGGGPGMVMQYLPLKRIHEAMSQSPQKPLHIYLSPQGIPFHHNLAAQLAEKPAIADATLRLIPGVLGDAASAVEDSFHENLLDHPHYTRPENIGTIRAPEILLSGDHARIAKWRLKQALGRTFLHRPDILEQLELSDEQRTLLNEFLAEHTFFGEPS